jgi:hypothetical protein
MNKVNNVLRPMAGSAARRPNESSNSIAAGADWTNYDRGLVMKRTTIAALSAVLGMAASIAFADPGYAQSTSTSGSGSISGSNSNSNSNSSLKNSNKNSNVNSNRSNSNANSNSNSNANSNSGSNSNQSQGQGQNLTYNYTDPATQTIKNVPNVYAPALAAAGSEVCLGSLSAGGAAAGFGVTVGGTMVDQECQLRMNARTLATLGYAVAAREEMCVDPQVRAAMLAAGTPCAADRAAPPLATAEYNAPAQAAANVATVAAAPAPQALMPAASPGCRKEYQLIGGWYEVCPPAAQAVYASADSLQNQPTAPTAQDSTPDSAPNCRKGYQLLGGWYDECK